MEISEILGEIFVWVLLLGWFPPMIAWYYRYGNVPLRDLLNLPLISIAWGFINVVWAFIGIALLLYLSLE